MVGQDRSSRAGPNSVVVVISRGRRRRRRRGGIASFWISRKKQKKSKEAKGHCDAGAVLSSCSITA